MCAMWQLSRLLLPGMFCIDKGLLRQETTFSCFLPPAGLFELERGPLAQGLEQAHSEDTSDDLPCTLALALC